jgi:NADH-quinone oxidoreductase subunit N
MINTQLNEILMILPLSFDEWTRIIPMALLTLGGVLSLLLAPIKKQRAAFFLSIVTMLLAIFFTCQISSESLSLSTMELSFDATSRVLSLVMLLCSLGCLLISPGYAEQEDLPAELYSLLLFASLGMYAMINTQSLMMMFIGLETLSFALYVMIAMRRSSRFSSEASVKYFILGGAASGTLLYGIALLFGATGTMNLTEVFSRVSLGYALPPLYFVGVGLILLALLFKVGAVPLHAWAPDIYQGAPNNITAFMMSAAKLASFVFLAKVITTLAFPAGYENLFYYPLWVIAALTILVGNILALMQVDLKRVMAYSSIAHTGYMLVGLIVAGKTGQSLQSIYFYLTMYVVLNIAMMAALILLSKPKMREVPLTAIQGIFGDRPMLALMISVPLLSMAAIPLTSGFMGKVAIFSASLEGGELSLTLVALIGSIISAVYYIGLFIGLFRVQERGALKLNSAQTTNCACFQTSMLYAVGFVIVVATLVLGIFPSLMWNKF